MLDKMRFSVREREGSNSFKFSKIRINMSQHVAITFTACKLKFYIKRTIYTNGSIPAQKYKFYTPEMLVNVGHR